AVLGVIAAAAKAPEIRGRALAREPERAGALPDVAQRGVANVAPDVVLAGERRAALDVAVRLDADHRAPRAARAHVPARIRRSEQGLVRTEVPDVVPGPEADARFVRAALHAGEHRHRLEELVRLEQQAVLVGGPAHGHRELHEPRADPFADQELDQ